MKNVSTRNTTALMILGQLLLLVFISLWLRSQYKQSAFELERDLGQVFFESTKQLQDSILKTRFVEPLIESRASQLPGNVRMEYEVLTSNTDSLLRVNVSDQNAIVQPIQYLNKDSLGLTETRIHRTYTVQDSSSEMLADVVTIFFDEIKQEGDTSFKFFIFDEGGDSTLNEILNAKLGTWNLKVDHLIERSAGPALPPGNFMFVSDVFGSPLQVKYRGTAREVWMRIVPQILFSVVLFLVIGLAFFLMHKNIQAQMKLNVQQSQFVANVSHELRTPISTVKVALESVKSYAGRQDEAIAREYLTMASGELDRLENMVSEVLNTSLLEGGGIKLNKERSDVSESIRHAISIFQSRQVGSNSSISFAEIFPFDLEYDANYVEGVLLNLLDNAWKYGGGDVVIDVSMKKSDSSLLVLICDNGPGIPVDFREKIFERFFRVPSGDVHNVKGYGLGLTYSREIMRLHGGDLKCVAPVKWSTCFQLEFPI